MPNAEFFTSFGFFVRKSFLDAELCAKLRDEIRSSMVRPAVVYDGATERLDESIRRTKWVSVSPLTITLVKERLLSLKPALEKHFNLSLSGCQSPQFLLYREGDYFLPHDDGGGEMDTAQKTQKRRLSAVILLNGESALPLEGCYGGGSLTFYGLMDDPRAKKAGLPLIGEPGLLIAFRSATPHEVRPVTYGERYTIVSWYY